jgi:hypothetical protein
MEFMSRTSSVRGVSVKNGFEGFCRKGKRASLPLLQDADRALRE